MSRLAVLLASAVISAATIPALASECAAVRDIDGSRARWASVRAQSAAAKAADSQTICRTYAASFYQSVTLRQTVAQCSGDTDQTRNLVVLDSEIDAFNSLLASRCGG